MQNSGIAESHFGSPLFLPVRWFAIISVVRWTADQQTKIAVCPPLVRSSAPGWERTVKCHSDRWAGHNGESISSDGSHFGIKPGEGQTRKSNMHIQYSCICIDVNILMSA
jgi:hypothetical protein